VGGRGCFLCLCVGSNGGGDWVKKVRFSINAKKTKKPRKGKKGIQNAKVGGKGDWTKRIFVGPSVGG